MSEINPPRGTRDIIGEEAELYEYLFSEFKETARRHGFEPIITPTVEHFALFEAKSGEEIKRSMYVFEDKAGRLLALRPEVTASVVRAYLKSMRARPKPIRLYYVAQCFRYEEPQRARYREFWQGGLEVIGDPDINADVLVAYTASEFLERVGVKHFYEVGNVSVYRAFMKQLGVPVEAQDHVLHLIDKDQVDAALRELSNLVGNNVNLFQELVSVRELSKVEGLINDYKTLLGELYETVISEHSRLVKFLDTLSELGYEARYQPKLVRGLAYYTGLIFEYKVLGAETMPSIGGGGRYDGLTVVYGGPYEPSTGLALGIDRIALTLTGKLQSKRAKTIMIIAIGNTPLTACYTILRKITSNAGSRVQAFVYRPHTLSRGLEYSNKIGVDIAIILGEREYRENIALVKDLRSGVQQKVDINNVVEHVLTLL